MANPVIQFGVTHGFGFLTGWEYQDTSYTTNKTRANTLDGDGDEVVSKLHNEITEYTSRYKASVAGSAPTVPATLGEVINSVCLTSISLNTSSSDFVEMTLTGHNHANNAHGTVRTIAHGVTVDDGFGVTDFLGGTAGDNAGLASSSITISCEHQDVLDGDGDQLAGENYNPRMVATVDWYGTPSDDEDGTWDITSSSPSDANTDFQKISYTGEKALDFGGLS